VMNLPGLESGPHNILVEVSGSKNAASTGYRVTVDGFDVLNR